MALQCVGALRLVIYPNATPIAVVVAKDVAEQARDEIHEVMGDDADLPGPEGKS